MLIGCLFEFTFECLEVFEHFTLLPYKEDPSVHGEVFDERDVVLASTEGFCFG